MIFSRIITVLFGQNKTEKFKKQFLGFGQLHITVLIVLKLALIFCKKKKHVAVAHINKEYHCQNEAYFILKLHNSS
jgi:hypothetical protein